MKNISSHLPHLAIAGMIGFIGLNVCESKADPIDKARKTGVPAPGLDEVKNIAEEGFI